MLGLSLSARGVTEDDSREREDVKYGDGSRKGFNDVRQAIMTDRSEGER